MNDQSRREVAHRRVGGTRRFHAHLVVYVVVITALAVINLRRSPENLWFIWPLAGWGIGVLYHAASTFGWLQSK